MEPLNQLLVKYGEPMREVFNEMTAIEDQVSRNTQVAKTELDRGKRWILTREFVLSLSISSK